MHSRRRLGRVGWPLHLDVRPMADPRIDHPTFFCADCHVDTYANQQYYMLKNRVWRAIAPSDPAVMLCLPCAERRLVGR
jgi:hypothetical protein